MTGKIVAVITGKTLLYKNDYLPRILDVVGAKVFDGMPDSDLNNIKIYFAKGSIKNPSLPKMALMILTADGMCGNNFGVGVDDNVQHETGLRDLISDYTPRRDHLNNRYSSLFKPIDQDSVFRVLTAFNLQAVLSHRDTYEQTMKKLEK